MVLLTPSLKVNNPTALLQPQQGGQLSILAGNSRLYIVIILLYIIYLKRKIPTYL